jgi:small-conductance mechanosensitive channel
MATAAIAADATAILVGGSRKALLALLVFIVLLLAPSSAIAAEPPPGFTKQQFDALVAEVSESVARSLVERGIAGRPPDKPFAAPEQGDVVAARTAELIERLPEVLTAIPALPAETVKIAHQLDRTPFGGRSAWSFLCLLAIAGASTVALGLAVRRLTGTLRKQVLDRSGKVAPFLNVLVFAIIDLLALALVWFAGRVWLGALFSSAGFQTSFAELVLNWIVAVAIALCVADIWLRPHDTEARLAPLAESDATHLHRVIVMTVALVVASRAWVAMMQTPGMIQAVLLVNSILVPLLYLTLAVRYRKPFGGWLSGLARRRAEPGEAPNPLYVRLWLGISMPFIALFAVTRIYAALLGRPEVARGTIATLLVFFALLLGETLIGYIVDRLSGADDASGRRTDLARPASRIARIVLLILSITILLYIWLVEVLVVVTADRWPDVSRSWLNAALILFFAVVAWEVVKLVTRRSDLGPGGVTALSHDDEHLSAASRLSTIMPLLRIMMAIVIGAVAVLIVLSQLGVNITPLVAGASILGLAISFGSQTLVRDIVSGIFYLADDAFRVGEYIDCGNAKGTVEGFTLRSIRLRHQSGQVHTIPFGQLGQITNFSRDWATLKFNLRFERNTDLEKLRKVVKKIGQEMLDDPETKDEFLDQLKMQGVADIVDNAMIVRFKFTVRPNKPSFVQRQAIKRMVAAFAEAGIKFANATVSVQTISGLSDAAAAAAAGSHLGQVQANTIEAMPRI